MRGEDLLDREALVGHGLEAARAELWHGIGGKPVHGGLRWDGSLLIINVNHKC